MQVLLIHDIVDGLRATFYTPDIGPVRTFCHANNLCILHVIFVWLNIDEKLHKTRSLSGLTMYNDEAMVITWRLNGNYLINYFKMYFECNIPNVLWSALANGPVGSGSCSIHISVQSLGKVRRAIQNSKTLLIMRDARTSEIAQYGLMPQSHPTTGPVRFYHPYDFLRVRPSEAPVGILRRCCSRGHIRLRAPYGLTRLYTYGLVE